MNKSDPTSVRLSVEARQLMRALSDKLGVSQAAVLELAMRDLAKKHDVVYNALQKRR